jgi:predicted membrane chloride channel (bestrophin family)
VHARGRYLEADEQAAVAALTNPADAILGLAAARVGKMHRLPMGLDSISTVAITQHLDNLGAVQGGAERIATTPLPFPYQLLVHRTAYLYILLAPFAMAEEMGWYTPLFNAIVAYVPTKFISELL